MRDRNGFKLWWCPLLVLALLVLAAPLAAVAQEEGHDHGEMHGEMPEMTPEQQAEMQMWMKAATPGEEHAHLAEMAGDWNLSIKMWEEPGAEPSVSAATASSEMVMGGRYLHETVTGSFMGMPFVGEGLTGYDNVNEEYWSTWVDNMSTGVMTARGNWDEEAHGLVFHGKYPDPVKGGMAKSKSIYRANEDGGWVFEMWGEGDGGEMVKMMEITYERQ